MILVRCMLACWLCSWSLGASAASVGGFEPVLRVNGMVSATSEVVKTDRLTRALDNPPFPGRGEVHEFLCPTEETFVVTARSDHFDPYLILRDTQGTVLAEGGDGHVSPEVRLAFSGDAGQKLELLVCTQDGRTGPYELTVAVAVAADGPPADAAEVLAQARERVARLEERLAGGADPASSQAAEERRADAIALGRALVLQAIQQHYLGAFEASRVDALGAIEVLETVLGAAHPELGVAHNVLGQAQERSGRYAEARASFERSLEIFLELDQLATGDGSDPLYNLGMLALQEDRFEEAEGLLFDCWALGSELHGPDHPDQLFAENTLAVIAMERGDLALARERFEALLPKIRRVGAGSDWLADAVQNVAVLDNRSGLYPEARAGFDEAIELYERTLGAAHPKTVAAQNNLALLLFEFGNAAEGLPLLKRIVDGIEERGGPWSADSLSFLYNLTMQLKEEGRLEEARAYLPRLLERTETVLGPEHIDTAQAKLLALRLEVESASSAAGTTAAQGALEVLARRLEPGDPRRFEPARVRALELRAEGRLEEAVELTRTLCAEVEETFGAWHPNAVRERGQLALFLHAAGHADEAYAMLRDAHEEGLRWLATTLLGLTEADGLDLVGRTRWPLEALLALAAGDAARVEVYEALCAWKGQATRLFARSHGSRVSKEGPRLAADVRELRTIVAELSERLHGGTTESEGVRELMARRRSLEVGLRAALEQELEPRRSLSQLQGDLREGDVRIDFFLHRTVDPGAPSLADAYGPPRLGAWIVRSSERAAAAADDGDASSNLVHIDLGPGAPIEAAADAFHQALVSVPNQAGRAAIQRTGARLRRLLWDPLAAYVEDASVVLVVPDGFVARVPFAALPNADGGFLIERHAFVELADVPMSDQARADQAGTDASLLVCGGLEYGEGDGEPAVAEPQRGSARGPWPALPRSAREAEGIEALHRRLRPDAGRVLLLGREAQEARLVHELERHEIVHLATHAFFESSPESEGGSKQLTDMELLLRQVPELAAGIVCSGANDLGLLAEDSRREATPSPERAPQGIPVDGLLTAAELRLRDLSPVELLVLSGCGTGRGRPFPGEGLLGLRRACHVAGAERVLASLWPLADGATAELMQRFYETLWTTDSSPAAALRYVQLAMLRERRPPAEWAGLVLSTSRR